MHCFALKPKNGGRLFILLFHHLWKRRSLTQLSINSLISSISCTKNRNYSCTSWSWERQIVWKVFRNNTVFVYEVFANGRRLFSVLSHALKQVPVSIAHITCITQVALKFINYMLEGLISRTFSFRLILSLRRTGWITVWVFKLMSFSCLWTKSAESWTLKGGACTNAFLNPLNSPLPLPTTYEHCIVPKDLYRHFSVLRKCTNKFDCLMHEMVLIKELAPSLNVQSDSIQAKV